MISPVVNNTVENLIVQSWDYLRSHNTWPTYYATGSQVHKFQGGKERTKEQTTNIIHTYKYKHNTTSYFFCNFQKFINYSYILCTDTPALMLTTTLHSLPSILINYELLMSDSHTECFTWILKCCDSNLQNNNSRCIIGWESDSQYFNSQILCVPLYDRQHMCN